MWYTNMDFSRGTFMIRKFVDRSNWIRVTKFKDKTLKIKDKKTRIRQDSQNESKKLVEMEIV